MNRPRPVRAVLAARLLAAALLVPLSACSDDGGDGCCPPAGAGRAAPAALALPADLPGAVSVDVARAGPEGDVVVVGRVREVTPGLAAFTLVDLGQAYCGQNSMEGCPTPWDYCCIPTKELATHLVGVRVRGADGALVTGDVRPGLRALDVVAVRGRLVRSKDGDVAVEASGWHRRERPTLPDGLAWPK